MEAYRLTSPVVKVFRRGNMVDYRGAYDTKSIVEYIIQDCQPSIKTLQTLADAKKVMQSRTSAIILGFFHPDEVTFDSTDMYSMDAWGQFQASADALRG